MTIVKMLCHTSLTTQGAKDYIKGETYEFIYNFGLQGYEDVDNRSLFTSEPDHTGKSYKTWFTRLSGGTKKFSQMNAKELRFARADLQYRLQSTLRPSKVIKLTDEGVTLQGGALEGVYNAKKESLRVRGTNGGIGDISVAELTHAQNVLKRFYARANGLDMGGINL